MHHYTAESFRSRFRVEPPVEPTLAKPPSLRGNGAIVEAGTARPRKTTVAVAARGGGEALIADERPCNGDAADIDPTTEHDEKQVRG